MTITLEPTHDPRSLIRFLTEQRDLYLQLKAMSDQQASLIAEGDTERLLTLLAHRQRLVDALTRLNRDLTAVRQATPDLHAALGAEDRDRVRLLMDEVDGLLHAIIEQDDRDRQRLQVAQRGVGEQLRQTARAGSAYAAYRPAQPSVEARFTDRQG